MRRFKRVRRWPNKWYSISFHRPSSSPLKHTIFCLYQSQLVHSRLSVLLHPNIIARLVNYHAWHIYMRFVNMSTSTTEYRSHYISQHPTKSVPNPHNEKTRLKRTICFANAFSATRRDTIRWVTCEFKERWSFLSVRFTNSQCTRNKTFKMQLYASTAPCRLFWEFETNNCN